MRTSILRTTTINLIVIPPWSGSRFHLSFSSDAESDDADSECFLRDKLFIYERYTNFLSFNRNGHRLQAGSFYMQKPQEPTTTLCPRGRFLRSCLSWSPAAV